LKRRGFLRLVFSGTALVAPPFGAAQQVTKTVRIAALGNEDTPPWQAFRQALRDLGYIEGANVAIDWRWSGGFTERLPVLAAELVALNPDVIVASSTQAVRAAMQATSTIPIVMTVSAFPDKLGLVESLARPGGNVTGLSNFGPQLMAKRIELLKEIAPTLSQLAVLWNPASPVEPLAQHELRTAAAAAGVTILPFETRNPDAVKAALADVAASPADGLYAVGNPINFKGRQLIADFALDRHLPSIYDERLFVEAGGLISYAPSFTDLFRRAATYVAKILKGAKPADLPVEQPAKFELAINLKTARRLDLTVPPALLLRADQVVN
jgi:putative ABC transport system substrate-binding protein